VSVYVDFKVGDATRFDLPPSSGGGGVGGGGFFSLLEKILKTKKTKFVNNVTARLVVKIYCNQLTAFVVCFESDVLF